MKRIQQSGAKKRKLAEEKKQKREEALKNVPKISDMFGSRANVAGPSSNSTQTITAEDLLEKNDGSKSDALAAPSGENIEIENIPSDTEFGDFSDDTVDFDDEFDNQDELFLNFSTSSCHRDIETQPENENSLESTNRFPTDVAVWDLVSDISSLQKYWTKLGRFFFVLWPLMLFLSLSYS